MSDIQLIASLVARGPDGRVLLVRYDPDDERWWLPGADLEEYEHPDDAARRVVASLDGVSARSMRLSHVDSFRGRRGWHVVFHYLAEIEGTTRDSTWADPAALPPTAHRPWEQDAVARALGG